MNFTLPTRFRITLFVFFSLFTVYFSLFTPSVNAQVPGIKFPCTNQSDLEFHSLRPYQAAPCGSANKALYCSNDLRFIEDFQLAGHGNCTERLNGPGNITFDCNPEFTVEPHDLYVQLDDSMFPIMGNTEDSFDDAKKVNEYASWYLSGVNTRKETGIPTNDQVINFSGPLQKLLPSAIADAQRINTIKTPSKNVTYSDPEFGIVNHSEPQNHNQIVVCENGGKAVACDKGGTTLRLKDWDDGSLSALNTFFNFLGAEIWNYKYPPLPWQFTSNLYYQKAYNEWRGSTCVIIPGINSLACAAIPVISPNKKWADLYNYVPLSNTTDKKGAEYLPNRPLYIPSQGTVIGDVHADPWKNAPLYFAHTQEVIESLDTLNRTFTPNKVDSVPLPKTTETNYCSVVNVRTNKGDNLFPGDPEEMQVPNVTYPILQVECHEEAHWETRTHNVKNKDGSIESVTEEVLVHNLNCNAEVTIVLKTNTKTPNADEIWKSAVADSGSTFRRVYPKVEAGAPVSCIADIPTVTDVTYDPLIGDKTEVPNGGTIAFNVRRYPEDGTGTSPQLTFPHIGSIYEYFLKGIQTALRPQGYGSPQPVSGQNCTNLACGELPKLPTASGSCTLNGPVSPGVGGIPMPLRQIIAAAAQTYKVPPNLILGIMYGEGLFNAGRFNWNDTNVKNWATCIKIPNCNETGDDNFMGFAGTFDNIVPHIKADIQKLDPTRTKFSPCNLLDAIYAEAWTLHDSADGGGTLPPTCYGIALRSSVPNSCTWNNEQYESAIKINENGYGKQCFTLSGGCVAGAGGSDTSKVACPNGDTCEKVGSGSQSSHNACVWAVAHGQ